MDNASNTWFQISNQGFKRMQAGRTLGHLVREGISNVFDVPEATKCLVTLEPGVVVVEDDAPLGIQDKNLITTVFMTDKEEKHTTRGRKGLGLKELISAGQRALVETVGGTINFNEDGTRAFIENARTKGTRVQVWNSDWTDDKLPACIEYLRRFMPPSNITMLINGTPIVPSKIRATFKARLRTTLVRNGKQIEEYHQTDVHVRNLRKGEKSGWVYEMGVPVQSIDPKFNIDVQQRIPMNDNRDVVNYGYMPALYGATLDGIISTLSKPNLKERWVLEGVGYADKKARQIYVDKLIPSGAVIKTKDRKANDLIKEHGFELVDISNMPSEAQEVINDLARDAVAVANEIDSTIETKECDNAQAQYPATVRIFEWLAHELTGVAHRVSFMERPQSYNGHQRQAQYERVSRTLRFNTKAGLLLDRPLTYEMLTIFIHEMGHFACDEHNEAFRAAMEAMAGKTAHLLFSKKDEIVKLVSGTDIARATSTSKVMVEVKCKWEGCNTVRLVKPQDVFQVKYCEIHQKEAQKQRARERRQEKKRSE